MKLTTKFLKKIIKEEIEKEMNGDVVTVGRGMGGFIIKRNDEMVSAEELAEAFGEKGEELLSIALEKDSTGSVDQDAFIEYYLKPEMNMGVEDIAKQYAENTGAEFKEEEYNEEDY